MAKNNSILPFIIFALILIFFFQPGGISNTGDNLDKVVDSAIGGGENTQSSETDFISFRRYDENKNLIETNSIFSIVEGVPGTYYIDLTTTLVNTGDQVLSCELIELSPSEFDNAMTKTINTLPIDGKTAWTSSLIDVSTLEKTTATIFEATAKCHYISGQETIYLPEKTGSLSLLITPESSGAGFDISIEYGGLETQYCGDGICQSDEDSSSCPNDCSVSPYVIFRTSDLSYVSGTAVAYIDSCGDDLIAYGRTNGACTNHLCSDTDQLLNVPSATGTTKFWIYSSDVCICEDGKVTGYPYRYSTSDDDASKVDIDSISFNSAKEVTC